MKLHRPLIHCCPSSHTPTYADCTAPLSFNRSLYVDTWPKYAGACAGVIAMGLCRHLLAIVRQELGSANARNVKQSPKNSNASDAEQALMEGEGSAPAPAATIVRPPIRAFCRRRLGCSLLQRHYLLLKLADAVVFAANAVLGFCNMLVAMSFNPGLLVCVVLGEVMGVLITEAAGSPSVAKKPNSARSDEQWESLTSDASLQVVRLQIEGMTCSACCNTVRNALLQSGGVVDARVVLLEKAKPINSPGAEIPGTAEIAVKRSSAAASSPSSLIAAVEGAGYDAKVAE